MKTGLKQEGFESGGILTDLLYGNEGKDGGKTQSPYASATPLDLSLNRMTKEVSILQSEKDALEAIREVQHLKLIKIQNKILDAVTEEKLECASLPDLIRSFGMLKDKEHIMTGKATSITGIVGYLIQLEQEDARKLQEKLDTEGKVVELSNDSFQVSTQEETPYEESSSFSLD